MDALNFRGLVSEWPLCVAIGVGVAAGGAWGQPLTEGLKVMAGDEVAGDQFGYATALANDLAVIGSLADDDNGTDSGAVYVFDLTIDAPFGAQKFKLLANDGVAGDAFGVSVAIDSGVFGAGVIGVGAEGDDDNGLTSGSAYLFNAATGAQLHKLLPNDPNAGDRFGRSIAIDGGIVAVGAYGDDDHGSLSGSVYLFLASTGVQFAKLVPSHGAAFDHFGYQLAMSGGILVVGSHGHNDNGDDSGAVFLFDASTGAPLFELLASDGVAFDYFGESVAIHNGVVAVGAVGDDDNGGLSGSAYLFDASTGAQLAKLLPNDGGGGHMFGISIGIDSTRVLVGAWQDNDNGSSSGSVYQFNTGSGVQIDKFLASDGTTGDQLGFALAIDGETVVAGAHNDDDRGAQSGSAYVFFIDCPVDFNNDGFVDSGDINAFIALFLAQSPAADLNNDGFWDTGDINAFIAAFLKGC